MTELIIAPLTTEHIEAITSIHMAAFPNRALTFLGQKAVARYYDTLLHNPNFCLSIGVFENQKLVGYLVGGEVRGTMRSFLKDHSGYLILHILTHPWLLAKPIVRDRMNLALVQMKARKPRPRLSVQSSNIQTFSVLVIAVDPTVQHKGAGKLLMGRAERVAIEHNYARMHLSVDVQNTQAIRFYERLKWSKDREHNWRGSMVKILAAEGAPEGVPVAKTAEV